MSISIVLRAIIVALSLAGVAYISVAFALSLVPTFHAVASLMVFLWCGLVAIADI